MPTNATYKLHYFPLRARAEGIRFILHQAGVPFEDIAVPMDQWPKLKPNSPMGQLPYLEVNGKKLGQSKAIARYIANKHGLAGKTEWEKAEADMVVAGVEDCMTAAAPLMRAAFGGDAAKTQTEWNTFKSEGLKKFLETYTKLLAKNKSGWFVGSEVTWADLIVADFVDRITKTEPKVLNDFPAMKAHKDKVYKLPKIAAWVAKRPDYPM